MKAVIVGCGRVGSVLADTLDRAGNDVIVIDTSTSAFDRLPGSFGGAAVRGDGTDEDTLRRAGAESADLFMAMTEGDNRNVMAAQLAVEALDARQVIAKINDPLRAAAYADLGITTLCRTNLMGAAVNDFLGLDLTFGPGISEATGHHPGGEHHADTPGPGGPSGQGNPASPPAAGGVGASSAGSTGPAAGPGAAPGTGPGGSSASTLAPATPFAGREG
ncbi:MAG: trk/ktr system potassium uptake protein [Chloroflexota bacterium]|nr:trk/ktr system potassium uptake protein [Chloroflexota bacterium]